MVSWTCSSCIYLYGDDEMIKKQNNLSEGNATNQGQGKGQSQTPKEVPSTTEKAKKSADPTGKIKNL